MMRRALESVAPIDAAALAADRAAAAELLAKAQAAAKAEAVSAEAASAAANVLAAAEAAAAAKVAEEVAAANAEPSPEHLAALSVLFEAALAPDIEAELVSDAVAADEAAVAPEESEPEAAEPTPTQAEEIDAALLRAERAARDAHGDALAARTRVEDEVERALKDQLSQALASNVANLELKSRDELYLTAVTLINQQHQRSLAEAIMMHTLIQRQGAELRDLHELELDEALTALRSESFKSLQDSLQRQEVELEGHWAEIAARERSEASDEHAAAMEEALRHTKERLDETWAKAVLESNGALEARWQEERVARLATVRELGSTVEAICEYAERRSDYEEVSHHAHRTTLALIAVRECLDKGTPITNAIKTLEGVRMIDPRPHGKRRAQSGSLQVGAQAGAIDPIIDVALGAIPPTLLTGRRNKLATLPQLQQRFAALAPGVHKASLTPESGGFAGKVLGAVTAKLINTSTAATSTDEDAGLNTYGVVLVAQKQLAGGDLAACVKVGTGHNTKS
jgi:hypothetical protein